MFKVCNKNSKAEPNELVLVFLLLSLNIFRVYSTVFIVEFEQVNVSCVWFPDVFKSIEWNLYK